MPAYSVGLFEFTEIKNRAQNMYEEIFLKSLSKVADEGPLVCFMLVTNIIWYKYALSLTKRIEKLTDALFLVQKETLAVVSHNSAVVATLSEKFNAFQK